MKINKIYVIGAQHGNEVFGLKILTQLEILGNSNIITRIGNAEAIAKKISFVESDLNRSFGAFSRDTQESRLAKQIINDIENHQPDLIIDIHTSRSKRLGKVGILAEDNPLLAKRAAQLGMDQIAIMPPHIHEVSLIGQYKDCSISLEYGKGLRSDTLAKETAAKIAALLSHDVQALANDTLPVYIVERTIKRTEATAAELQNYTFHKDLQGYPFLTSDIGYKVHNHLGFLARKKEL